MCTLCNVHLALRCFSLWFISLYTVLIEIIIFPSLHLNKNASLLMIRNDVFTGTVSASTPLSTQIRFVFVIIWKFKTFNWYLIWVDNGVDAETVPVNTSFLIINKDTFLLRCKLGKTIISIRTVYRYAPPNYSSHQTFISLYLDIFVPKWYNCFSKM